MACVGQFEIIEGPTDVRFYRRHIPTKKLPIPDIFVNGSSSHHSPKPKKEELEIGKLEIPEFSETPFERNEIDVGKLEIPEFKAKVHQTPLRKTNKLKLPDIFTKANYLPVPAAFVSSKSPKVHKRRKSAPQEMLKALAPALMVDVNATLGLGVASTHGFTEPSAVDLGVKTLARKNGQWKLTPGVNMSKRISMPSHAMMKTSAAEVFADDDDDEL